MVEIVGQGIYKVKVTGGNNPGSAVVKSNVKLARLLSTKHRPGFDPPWNQSSRSDGHLGDVLLGIPLVSFFLFLLNYTWSKREKIDNIYRFPNIHLGCISVSFGSA